MNGTECSINNGGCSHLCLLAPGGGRKCACPNGVELLPGNKSCSNGNGRYTFCIFFQCSFVLMLNLITIKLKLNLYCTLQLQCTCTKQSTEYVCMHKIYTLHTTNLKIINCMKVFL